MSGFWGMRCFQVVSIAPSGVNVALAACKSTGCSGVPPAGGTTSAAIKAEGKCLLAREKKRQCVAELARNRGQGVRPVLVDPYLQALGGQ